MQPCNIYTNTMHRITLTYRHAATPCPTFGGRTGEAFMGIDEAVVGDTVEAVLPGGSSEAKTPPPIY